MPEISAVDVGALFRLDDGEVYRVSSVWVDEDGNAQLTIDHQTHDEKIAYTDLRDAMVSGVAKRINTPHEAWRWRTN